MKASLPGFVVLAGLSLVAAGCGGVRTYPVSGTVTLDGKPLPEGTIFFRLEQAQVGTDSDSGPIQDGKYQLQARPGKNRVEVRAERVIPGKKNPFGGPWTESIIPPRYNAKSTLTADVTRDGPNEFNFDLQTK